MKYKSTYELLKPIVDAIDKTFTIQSVTDNTDGTYTLFSCNTLWACQGFNVTIQGNVYKITTINPDVSITVKGTVLPTKGTFNLYPPVFYHGTIKATDGDLLKKINSKLLDSDRLPIIWLHEPTEERVEEDKMNAIAFRANCEIYFMVKSNFAEWTNDDHYTYAIKPMRGLITSFMDSVRKARTLNETKLTTSKPKDFARWGIYMGKDGGEKTIFSMPMSGCRFDIEIPFIKTKNNCC